MLSTPTEALHNACTLQLLLLLVFWCHQVVLFLLTVSLHMTKKNWWKLYLIWISSSYLSDLSISLLIINFAHLKVLLSRFGLSEDLSIILDRAGRWFLGIPSCNLSTYPVIRFWYLRTHRACQILSLQAVSTEQVSRLWGSSFPLLRLPLDLSLWKQFFPWSSM